MKNGRTGNRIVYLLILLLNITVVFFAYFFGVRINAVITLTVFTVLFAGFTIAYVFYNRGFTRRGLKPEMLPMEWSYEKRCAYIADGERRLKKSKWMLTVIIPFVAVVLYEVIDIYIMPSVVMLFG